MSRLPEKHILEELQRYDSALDVRWVEKDHSGQNVQRWLVVRKSRGEEHPVLWVQNDDRSYRPFDQRVLQFLRTVDSWKVLGTEWRPDMAQKNMGTVNRAMNEMGYKAHNMDTFREGNEKDADERYHDWVPELADRLYHSLQSDHSPFSGFDGLEEERRVEKRTEMGKRVREAQLKQEGALYFDHELGCVAVRN